VEQFSVTESQEPCAPFRIVEKIGFAKRQELPAHRFVSIAPCGHETPPQLDRVSSRFFGTAPAREIHALRESYEIDGTSALTQQWDQSRGVRNAASRQLLQTRGNFVKAFW
jgi:hypothetical protein